MDTLTLIAAVVGGLLVLALGAGLVIGYRAARAVWREDVADAQQRAAEAERGARQLHDRYDALLLRLSQLDSGPIDALMHATQKEDAAPPPGRPPARHRRPRPAAVRPYAAEIPPAAPTGPSHN